MDALLAVLIIFALIGLRFGVPLLVTVGFGRVLNLLAERWNLQLT